MHEPRAVVIPQMVIRVRRIKPNGRCWLIHEAVPVVQTPSRESWFAGRKRRPRTSAGTTGSRHPPWFLQPGWQIQPQSEAGSLLMSCLVSNRHQISESREEWRSRNSLMTQNSAHRLLCVASSSREWQTSEAADRLCENCCTTVATRACATAQAGSTRKFESCEEKCAQKMLLSHEP